MGVADLYRDRASLGHIPVLRGQTLIETPYRLQADADTTALWWFDDPRDKKGTNHIGLIHVPTCGTGGPFGSDLTFDGANDCGVCAATIDFTSALTVEAVLKTTTTSFSSIIHGSNATGNPCYGTSYRFTIGYLNHLGLSLSNGAAFTDCFSTTTDNDGAYHYFVGRLGSAVIDLFKDGGNIGTIACVGNVRATTRVPTIARGTTDQGALNGYLAGSIAMIRISAVARSNDEILTNAKLMGFA